MPVVQLDYHRFLPTGRAYLTFTHADFVKSALRALQGATIATLPVYAQSSPPPPPGPESIRARGAKGFDQAVERSVIRGNGPSAGISGSGKNVVLYGMPGRLTAEELTEHLRGYKLAEDGKKSVVKQEL